MSVNKSIICFGAHPDDIEIGCAGLLKKQFVEKHDVYFVVLTNGEHGFKLNSSNRDERIEIRRKEQLELAEALGIKKVYFLGQKDGFLEYSEALRRDIVELIKTLRPEIIFSFDPANQKYDDLNLYHRDHRIAAQLVFDACFAAKNAWMYPGKLHAVKQIYFYASDHPNHYEDVSDLMDFKLELISLHRSQFPDQSELEKLLKQKICPPFEKFKHAERFRIMDVYPKKHLTE